MKNRRSMWITKAAAVTLLVGGLGGVARATILSAGGFPGVNVSTGGAYCALTNTGTRGVTVTRMGMVEVGGAPLGAQPSPGLVSPGQTIVSPPVDLVFYAPGSCMFDVSTKTGVRAALVYQNGSALTIIPAQYK